MLTQNKAPVISLSFLCIHTIVLSTSGKNEMILFIKLISNQRFHLAWINYLSLIFNLAIVYLIMVA